MMKIFKTKKFFAIALGALSVLAGSALFFHVPEKEVTAATAEAPTVHIQWGDAADSSPQNPENCNNEINGGGSTYSSSSTTDPSDPDCLRVRITNPSDTVYTKDFRICLLYTPTNTRACTGWAAGSVGYVPFSPMTSGRHFGNLAGTMTAEVETRPMTCANGQQPPACAGLPSGVTISNLKIGVGLARQEGSNGQCIQYNTPTAFKWGPVGTDWFGNGFWAISSTDDDDPGCFQVGMRLNVSTPVDAEYVSTTIPSPLAPNNSYNGNYRITMKNTGQIWPLTDYPASSVVRAPRDCSTDPNDYQPGETCTDYQIISSQRFRMERFDSLSTVEVTSKQIRPGQNDISYSGGQYTYSGGTTTIPAAPTPPATPPTPTPASTLPFYLRQNVTFRLVIEPAYRECEPREPGQPLICVNYPEQRYVTQEATPVPYINFNDIANLTPINLTIGNLPAGTHNIKFRMVDLENLGNNSNGYADGRFGDTVIIPITVAGDPGPALSCTVSQRVMQGQTAVYSLAANNLPPGYNSEINVRMGSNPAGPVMVPDPIILGPDNRPLPYRYNAQVPTTLLSPGTYNLTFTGSVNNVDLNPPCPATLIVDPALRVELFFNGVGGTTQPSPSNGSTGELSWSVAGATGCYGEMELGEDTTRPRPWVDARAFTTTNPPAQPLHTFNVNGMQSGESYTFKISCTNSTGQSVSDNVRVDVGALRQPELGLSCTDDPWNPTTTCTIPLGSSAMLYWDSRYTRSCEMNPYLGHSIPTVNLEGESTGNLNTLGNHYYTATCPGAPGTTPAVETVNIITEFVGQGPLNVTIDPGLCDQIVVTWDNPRGSGPKPDSFNVYRRISSRDTWSLDPNGTGIPYSDIAVDGPQYIYVDKSPMNPDGPNYYSVRAVYGGIESNGTLSYPLSVVPTSCVPSINLSDKDLYRVEGRITQNFNGAIACSGRSEPAALPNGAIFAVNDIVFFQINICNSGSLPMTGITVRDTMYNLINPEFVSATPAGCVTRQVMGERTADFVLADIPAAPPTKFCSIKMKARVTAPDNPSAAVYRFQNVADVTADGGLTAHLFTPPYLFSLLGGVPERNETGPQ